MTEDVNKVLVMYESDKNPPYMVRVHLTDKRSGTGSGDSYSEACLQAVEDLFPGHAPTRFELSINGHCDLHLMFARAAVNLAAVSYQTEVLSL